LLTTSLAAASSLRFALPTGFQKAWGQRIGNIDLNVDKARIMLVKAIRQKVGTPR